MLPDPMSPEAVTHEVNVVPMNFRKDYAQLPGKPGEFKEVHSVDLVKRGSSGGESTPWKISTLKKDPILWPAIGPSYERWLEGQEDPVDGTPVDAVAFIPKGLVDHLRSLQIKSVEDLAKATDSDLERIGMGARMWRQKAISYVESKQESAQMAEANAGLIAQVEQQQTEIDELKELINAQAPKRRGRPPKNDA